MPMAPRQHGCVVDGVLRFRWVAQDRRCEPVRAVELGVHELSEAIGCCCGRVRVGPKANPTHPYALRHDAAQHALLANPSVDLTNGTSESFRDLARAANL